MSQPDKSSPPLEIPVSRSALTRQPPQDRVVRSGISNIKCNFWYLGYRPKQCGCLRRICCAVNVVTSASREPRADARGVATTPLLLMPRPTQYGWIQTSACRDTSPLRVILRANSLQNGRGGWRIGTGALNRGLACGGRSGVSSPANPDKRWLRRAYRSQPAQRRRVETQTKDLLCSQWTRPIARNAHATTTAHIQPEQSQRSQTRQVRTEDRIHPPPVTPRTTTNIDRLSPDTTPDRLHRDPR